MPEPIAAVPDPDDADPATEPDLPDEVKLLDSGRVRCVIDGATFTLRRPKLGELREFREKYAAVSEAANISASSPSDAQKAQRGYDLTFQLSKWCFQRFSDKRLPTKVNDLPPWLESPRFLNTMMAHWQSVPLASGDR